METGSIFDCAPDAPVAITTNQIGIPIENRGLRSFFLKERWPNPRRMIRGIKRFTRTEITHNGGYTPASICDRQLSAVNFVRLPTFVDAS